MILVVGIIRDIKLFARIQNGTLLVQLGWISTSCCLIRRWVCQAPQKMIICCFNDIMTLPETNSSHLKIGFPKRKLIFQPSIFSCENVSFVEGNQLPTSTKQPSPEAFPSRSREVFGYDLHGTWPSNLEGPGGVTQVETPAAFKGPTGGGRKGKPPKTTMNRFVWRCLMVIILGQL